MGYYAGNVLCMGYYVGNQEMNATTGFDVASEVITKTKEIGIQCCFGAKYRITKTVGTQTLNLPSVSEVNRSVYCQYG